MPVTSLQQQNVATLTPGLSETLQFSQFDPTLGTLTAVRLTIGPNLSGSLHFENVGANTLNGGVVLGGELAIIGPNGSFMAQGGVSTSTTITLGAFDGTRDFIGASGTTIATTATPAPLVSTVAVSGPDLTSFTGTGSVDLTVWRHATSSVSGTPNWLAELDTNIGGVIGLEYDYIAAGTTNSGGSSGSVFDFSTGNFDYDYIALETASQTFILDDSPTGWTQTIDVVRFDPMLGTLVAVNVSLVADVTGHLSTENLGQEAATVTLSDLAKFSIETHGSTVLSFTPAEWLAPIYGPPRVVGTLQAYDGTTDFGGLSGLSVVSPNAVDDATHHDQIQDAALLSAFTGSGTEAMTISTIGDARVSGGGTMLSEFTQTSGGVLSISYVYTTAEQPNFLMALACFAEGTRIATPDGAIPVETLRPGMVVTLADGTTAPITWVGHREVDCARHPDPVSVHPIRIARDAFGHRVPARDLYLSPDHAIFTDGVLIPIRHLVNATTIHHAPTDKVTYYHVELPSHAALLAEGLPTESYLDTGDRRSFANGGALIQAHPRFGTDAREGLGFAPLVITGPVLEDVRAHLETRRTQRRRTAA